MTLDSVKTSTTDFLRYIVLRPYPDVRAIRILAEIERELAEGKDSSFNYEAFWMQDKIRAPFITSLKRGRNPFIRSRFIQEN